MDIYRHHRDKLYDKAVLEEKLTTTLHAIMESNGMYCPTVFFSGYLFRLNCDDNTEKDILLGGEKQPTIFTDNIAEYITYIIREEARNEDAWNIVRPYVKWVIIKFATGGINRLEDIITKAVPALINFDTIKRSLPVEKRDINRYKNLNELMDEIDKTVTKTNDEIYIYHRPIDEYYFGRGEATQVIYDAESNIEVIHIMTESSACHFGFGSRWCTSYYKEIKYTYDDKGYAYKCHLLPHPHNAFKYYNSRGNLYVVRFKNLSVKNWIQIYIGNQNEAAAKLDSDGLGSVKLDAHSWNDDNVFSIHETIPYNIRKAIIDYHITCPLKMNSEFDGRGNALSLLTYEEAITYRRP